MWHSFRSLFDMMVGNYVYVDLGNFEKGYSIMVIIYLMITNVFLLNYMVAVIDAIFEYMLDVGEFKAKRYKFYYYTSKKQIFDLSPDDLDNMVIHPPPYNIFGMIIFFVLPFKTLRKTLSVWVESVVFWIDNIILTVALIFVEILLIPICYFKIMF